MMIKKYFYLLAFCSVIFICSCGDSNFNKAVAYQNDGEYAKAVEFYKKSIDDKKNVALSEKNLGDIFFAEGKYEDAFKNYRIAIEINPNLSLNHVMQFISYNDKYVRNLVSDMLCSIKNEQAKTKILENLSKILNSQDDYKILDALEVILKLRDKARPISQDILKLLDRENPVIKQKVLEFFPFDPEAVVQNGFLDKVIELLNQDNEMMKTYAMECLGGMHGYATKALPFLVNISINEPIFKDRALSAIERIGLPTKEQAEKMYDFFKDKPVETKVVILEKFEDMREKANEYVPYIMLFLNDENNTVKQSARSALAKIGKSSPEAVGELIKLLQEPNNEIKSRAIYELGDLGKSATQAIEPLKQLIDSTDNKEIKSLAENALQKIQ